MFTRSPFHLRQFIRARSLILWALCAVLFIAALAMTKAGATRPIRHPHEQFIVA